ncbi:winged helix-turn-helix transcriptional regulator [Clostridium sp. CS001]|uniref:winged helix-turn-helix transcriptional regulator n=1 Tax=Clostridium sp. CS001 TaxID=2880648 RepID=UPI0021F4C650|nr:helix-turn-helix domain-containing protein [Clostridium sp. CS001]
MSDKIMKINNKEYSCAIELTLDIIGGKWKPIILWRLAKNDVLRFSELKRSMGAITQKMLTQQLRELEAYEMVNRKVYAEVPPKVEYSLTKQGKSVMPILDIMCNWGNDYYESLDPDKKE